MGLLGRKYQDEPNTNAKETTLLYLATLSAKEIDAIAATAKELHAINQKVKSVCYPQTNQYGEQ